MPTTSAGDEPPKAQRDEWMTSSSMKSPFGTMLSEKRKAEDLKIAEEKKKKEEEEKAKAARDAQGGLRNDTRTEEQKKSSTTLVGDGGASWRSKILKRAKERAEEEGGDYRDIVAKNHGVCLFVLLLLSALSLSSLCFRSVLVVCGNIGS
jgi:hypothetical protein